MTQEYVVKYKTIICFKARSSEIKAHNPGRTEGTTTTFLFKFDLNFKAPQNVCLELFRSGYICTIIYTKRQYLILF